MAKGSQVGGVVRLSRFHDIVFAFLVVMIIGLMVIPVPTPIAAY